MSTLRFNLRADKPDKSTKCPIELIYQVSGQRKYYLLKETKLNPVNWDAKNQQAIYVTAAIAKKALEKFDIKDFKTVILSESEVKTINNKISDTIKDIEKIEQRFELDAIPYTASMVIDALKGITPA